MSFTKKSIEQQLALANIAIGNALTDPSLATALAGFGYTAERLRQGSALHEKALSLYQDQKGAYGDAQTASDAYAAALALAHATYMRHVKVARVALEGERGSLQKLGLAGARKEAQAAQLAQAQQFYTNALFDPAILGKLSAFGITKEMLAAGQRQLHTVAQSDAARRQRQGAARDAKRARDAALAALTGWMRDFMQVARVALRDRPQLLEMLGAHAPAARRAAHPSPATAAGVAAPAIEGATPLPDTRPLLADDLSSGSAAAKRNGTTLAAVSE